MTPTPPATPDRPGGREWLTGIDTGEFLDAVAEIAGASIALRGLRALAASAEPCTQRSLLSHIADCQSDLLAERYDTLYTALDRVLAEAITAVLGTGDPIGDTTGHPIGDTTGDTTGDSAGTGREPVVIHGSADDSYADAVADLRAGLGGNRCVEAVIAVNDVLDAILATDGFGTDHRLDALVDQLEDIREELVAIGEPRRRRDPRRDLRQRQRQHRPGQRPRRRRGGTGRRSPR
jgi:hypothetical protein